jgi:hypothetical protein
MLLPVAIILGAVLVLCLVVFVACVVLDIEESR